MSRRKVPQVVIPRLSLYYRAILESRKELVSSEELSKLTRFSPSQVRRDLAYFGQFGRPGMGYKTEVLKSSILKILGLDREWKVVLVGAGNLGSALLSYKGFLSQGFRICHAFDSRPVKIGKRINSVTVKDIRELPGVIKGSGIKIAVITVPSEAAQGVAQLLIANGINAILNFAPVRLNLPRGVTALNIDLSIELERLAYFLARTY